MQLRVLGWSLDSAYHHLGAMNHSPNAMGYINTQTQKRDISVISRYSKNHKRATAMKYRTQFGWDCARLEAEIQLRSKS